MKNTKWKRGMCAGVMTMLMAVGVTGCKEPTEEEMLAGMKEYTAESESVSIHLDKDWPTEDVGIETWISAESENGRDAVVVAQLPKNQYSGSVDSQQDLQDMMDEAFQITEEETVEAPEVPGVSDLSAFTCKMSSGDTSGEGYVIYGESDYAYYMLAYVANNITESKQKLFDVSCSTFKETPQVEENSFSTEMTDTIRWFNGTYAILSRINNWNLEYFGGMAANEINALATQSMLESSWSVTDKASADENMEWILTEGHRTEFKEIMKDFDDLGMKDVAADGRKDFLLDNYEITEEEAQHYADMYAYYEQYGENAIDAWDYSRAISLAAFYYHAGYYTEQEALDKSLEIAQIMQPLYSSWDEAMNSYLLGYEYWSEESAEERRAIYEELKAEENSLYNIDWKLAFEKTW